MANIAGVVTNVNSVAKVNPETMAWDSGTQKDDSMLPYITVLFTKSILKLLASGSKPKTVVIVVSITGRRRCAPVRMIKSM